MKIQKLGARKVLEVQVRSLLKSEGIGEVHLTTQRGSKTQLLDQDDLGDYQLLQATPRELTDLRDAGFTLRLDRDRRYAADAGKMTIGEDSVEQKRLRTILQQRLAEISGQHDEAKN